MKLQRVLRRGLTLAVLAVALAGVTWLVAAEVRRGSAPSTPNPLLAGEAIQRQREAGPDGLAAFITHHAEALALPDPPEAVRVALDRICAQRDCHASRLYWYTDLEQAKTEAARRDRPILSLRLLGRLVDEYSCANSRYFRNALYANREVSDYLRDRFVLHWETVRPVPVLRVDMGDGRELKRTLTGNSIHYVLDADGRPRDALPGLYGPQAFLESLRRVADLHDAASRFPERADTLWEAFHRQRLSSIFRVWQNAGPRPAGAVAGLAVVASSLESGFVDARAAGLVALTKSAIELPILDEAFVERFQTLEARSDDELWESLALTYAEMSRLDDSSIELIAAKLGRGTSGGAEPEALVAKLRDLESRMALDSVRNELLLHRRIHEWFLAGEITDDVEALNERVYAELFLTPSEDAWLGLVPPDAYSGLDGDGILVGSNTDDADGN